MSQTNSTHSESEVKPYKGTGIRMETKLMQQYLEATPVNHGIQGAAVRNSKGQVELFTVGSDKTVWNFYPDSSSSTHYRRADTGLKGDFIAAGLDHGGSIVLLARSGDGVNYAVKYLVNGKGKWSAVTKATLPLFPYYTFTTVKIRAIYARTIDGQLYVGVDGVISRAEGTPLNVGYQAVSQWNVNAGSFQPAPASGWYGPMNPGMASFWTHSSVSASPAFTALLGNNFQPTTGSFFTFDLSGEIIGYTSLTDKRNQLLLNGRSATVDIDSPPDAVGRNKIFFVASDGTLYQLTDPTRNIKDPSTIYYRQVALSQGLNFDKVHADHDHKGGTHLFCVSKDKEMYHLAPAASFPTGYPPFGVPLKPHVGWVTVAHNDAGNIELFYAEDTPAARLIHMTLDQNTGDWEEQIVYVQGGGSLTEAEESGTTVNTDEIEEFISYSTDLSFTDPAGAPMVNTHVTVNASDRTGVTVNGATYSVDAITSASLKTNGAGQLTITQQTSGLSVPDLWVHVEGLMPADQVLILEQYANGRDDASLPRELQSIETRLSKMTGPDLENAKAKDKFLLKESIRNNPDYTASLAEGFKSCMKLASKHPTATPLHPLISREGAWTGAHIQSRAAALDWNRVTPHAGLPSWSLSFDEGGVQYQTHTPEEAQAIMAEMRATAQPATDVDGKPWWSTIGDFLEALVEKFVVAAGDFKRIIINGVNAAFEFFINGVKYVFNAVVKFVQDSFDMIESILAAAYDSVDKFFEKTFEWIGFLFKWEDILRTRDAVAHAFTQGLDFIPLLIDEIKHGVDGWFTDLNTYVAMAFSQLKSQVAHKSLGGFAESNRKSDPVFMHSNGNNFLMNGLVNNANAAKVPGVSTAALDAGPMVDFKAQLVQFADNAMKKDEFSKLTDNMKITGSAPDNLFIQDSLSKLIDLVQKFVEALLTGVHDLINKAFEALKFAVKTVQGFLIENWDIPFVTALYRHITKDSEHPNGSPLNLLDLLSLVIAIPTTTLYKIVKGTAPFPNKESLEAYKRAFTSANLLKNFKGVASEADPAGGEVASLDGTFKPYHVTATAITQALFWFASGANDILPAPIPPLIEVPGGTARAWCVLGFEGAAALLSCPWIYPSPPPSCSSVKGPPYNPVGAANAAWVYGVCSGFGIDAFFTIVTKQLPENWNDAGVLISQVINGGSAVFAGIGCAGARPLDGIALMLPVFPNFVKLGRLTAIDKFTGGTSVVVVATSDWLFGLVIGILTFAQGVSSASPRMLAAPQPAV
jgi:hypothetical protein